MKKILPYLSLIILLLASCKKNDNPNSSTGPTPVAFNIPTGFPAPKYDFAASPLTKEGIALGRQLFFDGQLSKDGQFPCGSCHQPFAAFANFEHGLSHGFNNQFTFRNSPGIINIAWMKEMHWDGGINHIEVQPLAPITNPVEMAETVENVLVKLNADPKYKPLFKAAYGDETINSQRMLKALAQFMLTLVSADSKYDRVKAGKATFTADESAGYQLFQTHCNTCHKEPLFTDNSYRNTGLPVDPTMKDMGRMRITKNPADSLKFKVPTLRNVWVTFPYSHDGRIYSVNGMIDHYRFRVVKGPTTDPLVINGLNISDLQRYQLGLFLQTLTDSTFLKNPAFQQPQ